MVSDSGKRLAVNISSKTPSADRGSPDPESESQPKPLTGAGVALRPDFQLEQEPPACDFPHRGAWASVGRGLLPRP